MFCKLSQPKCIVMAASFNLMTFVAVSAESERLAVKVTMHPVDCVCLYVCSLETDQASALQASAIR